MAGKFAAVGIVVIIIVALVIVASEIYPLGPKPGGGGTSNGKMAIMATDPPHGSGGNTKEYEHYNNIAAHRSGGGALTTTSSSSSSSTATSSTVTQAGSGWILLNASGTLELDTLVNASQTIAVANVQTGTYDMVKLSVDSATVTYNGKNYTATVRSSEITASLDTSAQVSSNSTAAIIFDLRTLAVNTGNSTNPQFVIVSSARAGVVSSSEVNSSSLSVGAKTNLNASAWFSAFASSGATLQITAVTLKSNSLAVTVRNTGAERANFTAVVLTPISILGSLQVDIPTSFQGSAVFLVNPNLSLQASNSVSGDALFGGPGASIATSGSYGGTYNLSYQGTITFGGVIGGGVQAGQSYLVTILGSNCETSTVVVAGIAT
jgi:hypothetical protein